MEIPESKIPRFTIVELVLLKMDRTGWLHERYCMWRLSRRKYFWKCVRDGGGGRLITPRAMTKDKAVAWLGRVINAEVFHVDEEHCHIFYRSQK